MILTPILILSLPIPTVQLIYGAVAAASAVLFVILARENPPTPPCPPGFEVRALMPDGSKRTGPVLRYNFFPCSFCARMKSTLFTAALPAHPGLVT